MDKIRFSKTDSRRTVMALAVVAMFVATLGVGNVDAAASPVSITSDKTSATVMVDDYVIATLTLDSSDSRYRNMDVFMVANWPSGTSWNTNFRAFGVLRPALYSYVMLPKSTCAAT